jgi:electron transfer flavoprotein beta subunit
LIFVCVKPVPDVSNLAVSQSQNRVFERGKRVLNPLDAHAIEAALKLGETTAVMVAIEDDLDVLRSAMARGCQHGLWVTHPDARGFDAVVLARVIAAVAKQEKPDTLVFGMGWPEDALGQVGYRVMEELQKPVVVVPPTGQPKLPSAMAIMKAMKKEIRRIDVSTLGVDLTPTARVKSLGLP